MSVLNSNKHKKYFTHHVPKNWYTYFLSMTLLVLDQIMTTTSNLAKETRNLS